LAVIDHYQISSCARLFSLRYSHFIHKTPLFKLPGKALGVDCAEVWLKLEHLQTGGSFKARGMLNRLISNTIPASGVVIASGGNAGIAVAAAAKEMGVRCEVFVPEVSSAAKRARLAALGATVVVAGAAYADAAKACVARQIETSALMAHAYDQPEVLVGSGTLALEIELQAGLCSALAWWRSSPSWHPRCTVPVWQADRWM
jgi:threonine dehydratase